MDDEPPDRHQLDLTEEPLMTPHDAAALLGIRTTTLARWAREGRLAVALLTLGGHRRYHRSDLRRLLDGRKPEPDRKQWEIDAARLYNQGWSVRQVADRFDCGYGVMRLILLKHTTLRSR